MRIDDLIDSTCERRRWVHQAEMIALTLEDRREQRVWRAPVAPDGTTVRLYSVIGPTEGLNQTRLHAALELNFDLQLGAIAIKGDSLVITQPLLVSEATEREVEQTIEFLAEKADEYERALFGSDLH